MVKFVVAIGVALATAFGSVGLDAASLGGSSAEDFVFEGETVIHQAETSQGVVPVKYEVLSCSMGDMGISKIEYVSENTLKIYSSIAHPMVFIMLEDGSFLSPVGFPSGNSIEENGIHIFMANPKGKDLSNEKLYFMFEDGDKVYEFSDLVIV